MIVLSANTHKLFGKKADVSGGGNRRTGESSSFPCSAKGGSEKASGKLLEKTFSLCYTKLDHRHEKDFQTRGAMPMTQQLPSDLTTLIIETVFPDTNTEEVFNYWTKPALLQKWWPQEVEI